MQSQHIRRVLNPVWPPAGHICNIGKVSEFIDSYTCISQVRGPFDLLGLFLSSIEAPFGATRKKFRLPVTAMYGRWCNAIGSPCPAIFQCTSIFFLRPIWWDLEKSPSRSQRMAGVVIISYVIITICINLPGWKVQIEDQRTRPHLLFDQYFIVLVYVLYAFNHIFLNCPGDWGPDLALLILSLSLFLFIK